MRVILETSRIGHGFVQHPGDEVDLPDREAKTLIESGSAIAVGTIETAMVERTAKTAALRRDKRN